MKLFTLFFVFLLLPVLAMASSHAGGGTNDSNSGGLPSVVERVELVERVLHVDEVDRINYPKMFVGGTEYEPLDPGKMFVQIDISGQPVVNASCFGTAWYPDTTVLFQDEPMNYLDRGIYFHDFTIPNTIGVFPVSVACDFLVNRQVRFGENVTVITGNKDEGFAGDTYVIDGDLLIISETVGGQRGFDFVIYFNDVELTANTSLITLDTFASRPRNGNDPAGDFINYWLYNWTSSSYVLVGTEFDYHESFVREMTILTAGSQDFTMNGTIILLVNDTLRGGEDNKDTLLNFDYISLETTNPVSNASVQVVRGGGELHVRNSTSIIVEVIDEPFELNYETLLLWICVLLLPLAIIIDKPVLYYVVGLYYVFYGILSITGGSSWFGMIIIALGFLATVVGFARMD